MNRNRPADITALSLLFAFGAFMCAMAGVMLGSSGGELHPIWRVIPALAGLGTGAVAWLGCVSILCVVAAVGVWRCSYWGYLTGSILLILAVAAHFFRALVKHNWWEIAAMVAIGALILWYLRSRARVFEHQV